MLSSVCSMAAYFYPRSPRGERHLATETIYDFLIFLSTLPARGATKPPGTQTSRETIFLSTLPARGATDPGEYAEYLVGFLSTLPARGATAPLQQLDVVPIPFLSTLPARGATG